MVIVTHEMSFAGMLRTGRFYGRGRIVEQGSKSVICRSPACTRQFLESFCCNNKKKSAPTIHLSGNSSFKRDKTA